MWLLCVAVTGSPSRSGYALWPTVSTSGSERPLARRASPRLREHAFALVDADDAAAVAVDERARDEPGPRRDVEHAAFPVDVGTGHEEAAPARILTERENGRAALIGGAERGEERLGVHRRESRLLRMDLDRVARAAAAHGEVRGVLGAESAAGERSYLVALADGDERRWLLFDADANAVDDRRRVRDVASLVAMCEVAAELAGEADEARIASPGYLDEMGTAELGAATGVVDAFVAEVEARYQLPLR